MTKTLSIIRVQAINKPVMRSLLAALAMGMLFTACKKDNPDNPNNPGIPGNPPAKEEGYYPSKTNGVWKYRNEDDGDVTEQTLSVVSQKDSAGGKVIHYRSVYSDGTRMSPFVHATPGQITYANTVPSELSDAIDELRQDPSISNLSLTGMPMLQKLPANPKAGDVIQFSEPVKLLWTQTVDDEDYDVSFSFGFSNGRVIGFEDVTTPAGTFKNCVKWQYKAKVIIAVEGNAPNEVEMEHTMWYAKGIGMVKAVETSPTKTNTSVLTSIQ